jgi:pyrroline-5-carboxylate reductase
MSRIGFIGYGSMGRMLAQGFMKSGGVSPEDIVVSTRTKSKLKELSKQWPGIDTAFDNTEAARKSKYIFLCVKPLEIKSVLEEIRGVLTPDSVIVSIAGSVSLKNIESVTGGKVTRVIPSLTSEVLEGISLVCHNGLVSGEEAAYIETLLSGISTVKRIREEDFDLATELTSCAPGFFAAILNELVQSALRQDGDLTPKDAEDMVRHTFYGTAKVLLEQNMGFDEMIKRVATKGGITEEGVKIFRAELPETYDHMFKATLDKRKRVREAVDEGFIS